MLSDPEIVAILSICAGYDNRQPGELNNRAWRIASEKGHWTFDEAADAVDSHYAEHFTYCMPAHVTQAVKAARRALKDAEHHDRLLEGTHHHPGDDRFLRMFAEALKASKEASSARRKRVLAYVDLRDRLKADPVSMADPEAWNGWIPPSTDQHGSFNNSPRRAALVDIAAEAMRRENAG